MTGGHKMIQINLTIDYDGKNYAVGDLLVYDGKLYNTNVITTNDTSDEEILQIAISQIEQQWKE